MGKRERELLNRAIRKFGYVEPCIGRSLSECFRRQNGTLQFWFNDGRGNTHLLCMEEKAVPRAPAPATSRTASPDAAGRIRIAWNPGRP
jgi:hypothetical protein